MAIKGSATITLTQYRDTQSVTRYYKLQPAGSSTPLKPETKPPSSDWTDSEPACDISKELYFCDLTIFSNGEWEYSKVSKSTSYEAAKQAYNKAQSAKDGIDNLEIGGRNLVKRENIIAIGTSFSKIDGYEYTQLVGSGSGITFPADMFTEDTEYVLSFKFQKVSGTLTSIAGHATAFETRNVVINGESFSPDWMTNHEIEDSEAIQTCVVYLRRYTASENRDTDNNLYIQPQRWLYHTSDDITIKYWDIKIEKGNKATDWTPAPEDVDAGINNVKSELDTIYDKTRSGYIETLSGSGFVQSTKTEDGGLAEVVVYGKSVQDGTPTPEAPVEIQSVENPKVTACGTNVFDAEAFYQHYYAFKQDIYKVTVDGVECLRFRGSSGYGSHGYHLFPLNLKPNTQYLISFRGKKDSVYGHNSTGITVNYLDGTPSDLVCDDTTTFTDVGMISRADKTITSLNIAYAYDEYCYLDINSICIREVGTEVEPYKGKTATLSNIVLRSTPNGTRDKLFKDADGLWKVDRKYGIVDLGTLDWSMPGTGQFIATTEISNAVTKLNDDAPNCLCVRYASLNPTEMNNTDMTISQYVNNLPTPYVHDSRYTSASEFKSAMSGVMLVYELATPTYETLPASIQAELNALTTYNPVTNVIASDGVTPDIDVSFWTRDYYAKNAAENAAKVATNYIHSDSADGLVVNNNQTVGVGYDIQLKADGSNTGMNIRQDGEILANFLQNSVSLGKNSINSKVGMCGDKGGVSASFGYYVDSVTSMNGEQPGSTLSFDFNETTFKNKVGQTTGLYEFVYTSAGGWELFEPVRSEVTLSQYGITMKTPTSSLNDFAQIIIKYVLDGSVKFYNADISNPVRKLELEMAENSSSSESDFANITIERQSGTYASGDGKEHSIITMMTLHEFANVATLELFDDKISLDASHLYLTSSYGDGSIRLDGNVYVNGKPLTGLETRTLLWENARPKSEFAPQTILNNPPGQLSEYEAVEVEFLAKSDDVQIQTIRVKKGDNGNTVMQIKWDSGTNAYIGLRSVSCNSNGVEFGVGGYLSGISTLYQLNLYCIPQRVYGIKEV